jgi:integrase
MWATKEFKRSFVAMAYIEKRIHNGKTTYRARIRVHGMPHKSASFSTRTAAKDWAHRAESNLKQSRYFPHDPGKTTFATFVDRYISHQLPKNLKALAKQTQIMFWWKQHLGKYYLSHISPSLIATLRDTLLSQTTVRGTKRSPSTTNRYLAALSRAFTICIREYGWLKDNPVLLITRPAEPRGRDRYLTLDEISRLLDACRYSKSPYLYPIVAFALATGARRGEILNLHWSDIDFTNSRVTFRHTKNGDSRTIYLPPTITEILSSESKRRIILSPFVFPSQSGHKPADIESAWDNAIITANLPKLRFHDLRHTAASHLAMAGASTVEIATILGHKTLAMVKRYAHFSDSAIAQTLKRMNIAIFGA